MIKKNAIFGSMSVRMFLIATLGCFNWCFASVAKGPMRGWTPKQYVYDMLVGWNLGNTMDAPTETGWSNPVTTQAMVDAIHKMGFKFMRLPVTWKTHLGGAPNYSIDPTWLARVVTIANYALNDSMYVMINIHHDGSTDGWFPLNASGTQVTTISDEVTKVWTQIANAFKDYGDYVVFEVFNEPNNGSANQWNGGDATSRGNLATFETAAVNAIRATGGNNAKRLICLPGISASPLAVSVATIPMVDENCVVSLHTYDPGSLSLDCKTTTWGSSSDSASLVKNLKSQQTMVASKHGTAIVGEWGTQKCADLNSRIKHAYYYAQQVRIYGMVPVWWDNGYEFEILNRKANPPVASLPTLAEAIVNGAKSGKFPIDVPTITEKKAIFHSGIKVNAGVISYDHPNESPVSMQLINLQGKVIWSMIRSHQGAGSYSVKLPLKSFTHGNYILKFKSGEIAVTKHVVSF